MKSADVDRITDWIVRRGLEGAEETDLLREFCEKCTAAALPIARALAIIDTLHPVHEGTVFRWRHAAGFSDADIAALRRLVPALGLAIKSAALAKVADNLVEVYLGRDAGRRVLEGRIQRGIADRIEAALWFSDLRSYTAITDSAPPGEIIPLLNDYAEAIITAIHEAGGDVLKLIGVGTLA